MANCHEFCSFRKSIQIRPVKPQEQNMVWLASWFHSDKRTELSTSGLLSYKNSDNNEISHEFHGNLLHNRKLISWRTPEETELWPTLVTDLTLANELFSAEPWLLAFPVYLCVVPF
jgi:hypothetical protein